MANKDLEFVLRFKNEARQVLQQARQDLKGLGQEAAIVGTQLRQMSGAGAAVNTAMVQTATGAQRAEIAQKRLEIQQARLEIQSQKLAQQQAGIALGEQRLALQTDRLTLAQQRLEQQKKRLNDSTKNLSGSFAGLVRQFLPLTAAAAAFAAIRMNDDLLLLRARVKNATQSTLEYQQAMSGLTETSRNTGVALEGAVSVFQRLSFVRKEINATTAEMLQFTDTVAKLGVISGASPDALKFGLTQLGQSLSSQIVRAEEFNSIMENIPAVGKQIADELGVSTGQLRLLVINGKLLSEDVFAAMLNASEKVNTEFNKFPQTVGRAFQGFLIDIQAAIGSMDEASDASGFLINVIYKLGKVFKFLGELAAATAHMIQTAFIGIAVGIQHAVAEASSVVEYLINKTGEGLHILAGTDFAPVKFAVEVDPDLNKDALLAINTELNAALKNLENADDIIKTDVFGTRTRKNIEKTSAATRQYSQNYADLVKTLQDGDTKGKQKRENFLQDVNNRIALMKEEMKWIGKSSKERERATDILKLQQEAIKAGIKDFDPSEYIAAYDALHAAQEKVHTDFMTGWRAAMQDFAENAKGLGDLAQDIFKQASDGISETISGLVDGTINSFASLRESVGGILKDLASTIARFVIQQQILMPLLGAFGFGGGAFGGGATTLGSGEVINWFPSAKGNAFAQGMPVKYFASGGVLNGPTAFPMRNGTAIGGEAGSEGLLPLKRLSNGDLGVQSDGSNVSNTTQLNYSPVFSISMDGSGGGTDKQAATQLSKLLDDEGKKMVLRVISEQQRPGGILAGGRGKTA